MNFSSREKRPAHTQFRDQVGALVNWFSNWNECEQTIALYTLLKRISNTQARFLSLILEHTFRDDPVEIQLLQKQANDKEFLKKLCKESKVVAVQQLLAHLPLLAPGNDEARYEYLQLLPKILTHSVQHSVHQDECMQLLSLALVHPAFPPEERNSLLCWLSHLEKTLGIKERQNSGPARLQTTESTEHCDNLVRHNYMSGRMNGWRNQQLVHRDSGIGASFDQQSSYGNYGSMGSSLSSMMKSRSNSLTPPPVEEQDSVLMEDFPECLQVETRPGRSRSFPVDPQHVMSHQLSPQSSTESEQDDYATRGSTTSEEPKPGMKDVPAWLKSLRLHKYSSLFCHLSYEEMLDLDENLLEDKVITKGARNKILLNIKKLKERCVILPKLEKEVLQAGKLGYVLTELRQIVHTPIKAFSPPPGIPTTVAGSNNSCVTGPVMEQKGASANLPPHSDDLPSWITRVMGKACTQIIVSRADEDHCLTFLQIADRTLTSDAFTLTQKRRIQSWKQQCQRLARQQQFAHRSSLQEKSKGWYFSYLTNPPVDQNSLCSPAGPEGIHKQLQGNPHSQSKCTPAGQLRSNSTETQPTSGKPRLMRSHAIVGRTKSLPGRPTVSQGSLQQQNSADNEGIDSLESLALRMTEQALSDNPGDRT